MSYTQTYNVDPTSSTFDTVIRAQEMAKNTIAHSNSPFLKPQLHRVLYKKIVLLSILFTERILGRVFYVKDVLGTLAMLSPEMREFLKWLTKSGYITSWRYNKLTPGMPLIANFALQPRKIKMPSGKEFAIYGAAGNGCGTTLENAAIPAVGEFVERLTTSEWLYRDDLIEGSMVDISKKHRVLIPESFHFYSPEQLLSQHFARSVYDKHTSMTWLPAKNAHSGRTVYIPASAVYMFYAHENINEPIFWEVNSNGAAAHTTYTRAIYSAVCELIERDAFLQAWYHQRACPKIDTESLYKDKAFPEFEKVMKLIEQRSITLTLVDITSDIQVPTVAAVIINPYVQSVAISSATDIDIKEAINKLLHESLKFMHGTFAKTDEQEKKSINKSNRGIGYADSFSARRKLWTQTKMITEMKWFTDGTKVKYQNLISKYSNTKRHDVKKEDTTQTKYNQILKELKRHNINLYFVEFPHELAKKAGLIVVRALSSNLIPMFFNEKNRPLGVRRFTHDSHGKKVQLNPVPHPFL